MQPANILAFQKTNKECSELKFTLNAKTMENKWNTKISVKSGFCGTELMTELKVEETRRSRK